MDNEAREKYAAVAKAEALKAVEEESALLRARALTLYGLMIWAQDHMEDDD